MGGLNESHTTVVEELDLSTLSWAEHKMSPVNGNIGLTYGFTAFSIGKSLFIFGQLLKSQRT